MKDDAPVAAAVTSSTPVTDDAKSAWPVIERVSKRARLVGGVLFAIAGAGFWFGSSLLGRYETKAHARDEHVEVEQAIAKQSDRLDATQSDVGKLRESFAGVKDSLRWIEGTLGDVAHRVGVVPAPLPEAP